MFAATSNQSRYLTPTSRGGSLLAHHGARLLLVLVATLVLCFSTTEARAEDYSTLSQRELENKLDETSLGGPIATLAVGGGLAIGGAVFTLYGAVFEAVCTDDSYWGYDSGTNCGGKALLIIGGTGLVVGATLATVGGVWLGSSIKKRRKLKRELDRRNYGFKPTYQVGLAPLSTGQGLAFKMQF